MTMTNHLRQIPVCTYHHLIPPSPKHNKLKLMNRKPKTRVKIDNNNAFMTDTTSSTGLPPGSHSMTTQSLACLAEKLKKLLETPTTLEDNQMECETKDLKIQTCASMADDSQN